MGGEVDAEVKRIEAMGLEEVRRAWVRQLGLRAPTMRSSELLKRVLTWRLQAAAEGGLSTEVRRAVKAKAVRPAGPVLTPGVRITREWKGRPCHVEVTARGFLFEGKVYDSLSEIARAITGVRWNGPRFFGLRKEAD